MNRRRWKASKHKSFLNAKLKQLQESTPAIITLEDSPVCEKANILETDTRCRICNKLEDLNLSFQLQWVCRNQCTNAWQLLSLLDASSCKSEKCVRVGLMYREQLHSILFRKLCFARFVGEQFDRTEAPLPKRVGSDNYVCYQCQKSMN